MIYESSQIIQFHPIENFYTIKVLVLDILIIIIFVILTASALIVLKKGSVNGAPVRYVKGKLKLTLNFYTILGIFLYGLSFLVYTYLISRHDLGYIIPLTTALVYLCIFPASHFLFNERFTAQKITGVCFIILGIILLNYGNL